MKIVDLPQIPQEIKDLLESIGCQEAKSLAAKNADSLCSELVKANKMLEISPANPTLSDVKKWIKIADEKARSEKGYIAPASDEESVAKVDVSHNENVLELLKNAPVGEKLKAELVRKENLAVSDIIEAILLDDCDEDVEIKTEQGKVSAGELAGGNSIVEKVQTKEQPAQTKEQPVQPKKPPVQSKEQTFQTKKKQDSIQISETKSKSKSKTAVNDESSFQDFDSVNNGTHHIKPLDRGEREVVNVTPELNKNVKSDSRRYIKGVLHPDPSRIRMPAIAVLLLQLTVIVNLIGVPYVFLSSISEGLNFTAIGALLGTLVVMFIFYIILSAKSSCRVCGQKQFVPKQCIKHKKAHHVPMLGHMIPTALQALIYKWFYCIYCGTAIRLKK